MIINFIRLIASLCFLKEIATLSCLEVKKSHEISCLQSEKDNYVQCVKIRMKRHHQECEYDNNCYECDCDSCSYSQCRGQCDECCNSCCPNYVQCYTNHCCHKQCHSECRDYSCRNSCRRSCYQTVQQDKEIEKITYVTGGVDRIIQPSGGAAGGSGNNTNAHNITTIINLKNVLNNTNFLDVPINLTYTNKNNITLHEAQQLLQTGSGDNCCIVIGPRQCMPTHTSPSIRCFHTRSRQCGSYCSASLVHEESREICNSLNSFGQPANCQKQTMYIPQPQPRCTYTSTWPYVTCGIQPPTACEGCYGHYFNPQVKQYKSCPPQCYDDFSVGPLYRQGPFYQPGYSHAAPCAYTPQGCMGMGMGGFDAMRGFGGGMGMTPFGGFGGYGYGYGQGFGGPFGYGVVPPQQQEQSNFPSFAPYFNTTGFNATSPINYTDLFVPPLMNGYQDNNMYFTPFNQGPPREVEIDMATDPQKVQPVKRGAGKEYWVETV